mmetsp:Transcript_44450/g.37295  ORF Transcript_44450/g.37295 Transcript_44450/m.37295 type:complete len:267 (+) Transcript_44450:3037-3837(+)
MHEVRLEIERYTIESNENMGWYKDKLEESNSKSNKLGISLDAIKEKSEKEIKTLQEKSETLNTQVQQYQTQIRRSSDNSLGELQISKARIEALTTENKNLKNSIEKRQTQLDNLKVEQQTSIEKYEKKVEDSMESIKDKDTNFNKLKAKYDHDIAVLNEKSKYNESKYSEVHISQQELQIKYEDLLKNGKSSEEMQIIKEKLDKSQADYQKSREKIEELTIKINTSESNLSKCELEYDSKLKRLEEKLSDSQNLKAEVDKTYKEQI